jgi:hypothetical protein
MLEKLMVDELVMKFPGFNGIFSCNRVTIHGVGLVIGFIEILQIRDYTSSLIHTFYSSLEQTIKSSQSAVSLPVVAW